MGDITTFNEVLESADNLSLDDQITLLEVLQRRIIEHRREELSKEIQDAQKEFQEGKCNPTTPSDLMKEILS
ncbi:hypothetical protein JW926_17610 [Candidatus Sumerlaeota bacterium]|nr:hypothetical protein [Candidatus Sumerlaeota bacterium]